MLPFYAAGAELMNDSFLTELADLEPADQALQLARALGTTIRAMAADPGDRREAMDNLPIMVERAAGLRL